MRLEIRALAKKLNVTTIYVTHDQEEALVLSDRIAVVFHGKIVQVGSPREIYVAPSNTFVAGFVGEANLLEVRVEADTLENGSRTVSSPMGSIACSVPEHVRSGEMVTLMFRPDSLNICKDLVGHGCNSFPGRVEQVAFVGSRLKCEIQVGSSVLLGEISSSIEIKQGDEVIVEHIAAKGMSFQLSTQDIIELKESGASDKLLAFMIKAGEGAFPFGFGCVAVVNATC